MKPKVMPFHVKEAKKGLKILNKTTIETAKTLGVVKITTKRRHDLVISKTPNGRKLTDDKLKWIMTE